MKAHRTIWTIAGAALILALIAFTIREAVHNNHITPAQEKAIDERDRLINELLTQLEKDPRVRRPNTKRLVASVAEYAQHPSLSTAETHYAHALLEYYREDDIAKAEAAYQKAIELDPNWSWPYNGLGILWFTEEQEQRGLKWFRKALELEPEWSGPHSDLAILYRRTGRMKEALREINTALQLEPNVAINHFNYGVILDELGQHLDARERYTTALELEPGLPPAIYNLACSYARETDLDRAILFLIESIELDLAFRQEAIEDPDFNVIRDHPSFIQLMQESATN